MKYILHFLAFGLITLITQVGGVFYLLGVILYKLFKVERTVVKFLIILMVYLVGIIVIVPPIAKMNNRVAMPVFKVKKTHVGCHTLFTALANRHYVRPELKQLVLDASQEVNQKYPGVKVEYLDGSFPLFKEWRMLPHLKHDDGTKLDISFIRSKSRSGKYSNRYFSFFGYGFSEPPKSTEENFPAKCKALGKWQYNIIEKVVPDQHWRELTFPTAENAFLVKGGLMDKLVAGIFYIPCVI